MRFLVLGPVEMEMDGRPVRLAGGRSRAMLATLLLNSGRVCPADQLIDAIWGTDPPATASAQLHIVASRLRAALAAAGCPAEENVATRSPGYLLPLGTSRCDLHEFRALATRAADEARTGGWAAARDAYRSALALWRGPACLDVTAPGVVAVAERLNQERVAVAERSLATALLVGACDEVLLEAGQLIAADPLRERAHYLLITAYALADRTGDALAAYQAARQTLATELGIDPGEELRGLERAVLCRELDPVHEVLRAWAGAGDPGAPATGAAVRPGTGLSRVPPYELPAEIPDFVGRREELAQLEKLLTAAGGAAAGASTPAIVSISGLGGVGKTALAVRAARWARTHFPDGCLFTSMDGAQHTPRDPYAVLGSLLRSLGLPGPAVPDDPDARLGLYRSMISDRRILVVIDDAVDERQVRPLLPTSGGSAAVVTSRRSLTGLDGAALISLDVLYPAEGAELLARLVRRDWRYDEQSTVDRLVKLCGSHPLAIRVVGARLSQREDLSLARMAQRLADEQSRLGELSAGDRSVRACLADSYRRLEAPASALLRLAGTLPVGTFPLWLAAALIDATPGQAERIIDQLVDAQLVQVRQDPMDGSPRYVLHDLVRLFAAERHAKQDPPELRSAALRRAYSCLLWLASTADSKLPGTMYPLPERGAPPVPWLPDEPTVNALVDRRNGTGPVIHESTGLPAVDPAGWFERERPLLTAAVRHAGELGWPDLAWRLAAAGTNAADLNCWLEEWIAVVGSVSAAGPGGAVDPAADAALLLSRGILLRAQGHSELALPLLRRARLRYRQLGDRHRAAVAATEAGSGSRSLGRPRLARAFFDWAGARFAEIGGAPQEGWVHLGRANLLLEYDTDRAGTMRGYERALVVLRRAGDRRGEANVLGCIGSLLVRDYQPEEAIGYLEASVAMFTAIGDIVNRSMAETVLARAWLRTGRVEQAAELASELIRTLTEVRHERGEAIALLVYGEVRVAQGRPVEAVEIFRRAVEIDRRLGIPTSVAYGLFHLAKAHVAAGDLDAGHRYGEESMALYAEQGDAFVENVRSWLAELP